jgi:hypothetical protein
MPSVLKGALLFCLISTTAAWSKTCYERYGCTHSGYLAIANKYTLLNDEIGVLLGGQASYLLFSQFGLGVAGYTLIDDVSVDNPDGKKASFYYTGGLMQWIFAPTSFVHGGFALFGGLGELGAKEDGSRSSWDIWVLEPEWFFQFNVAPWMQTDLGLSYRFVWGRGESPRQFVNSRWDVSHFSLNLAVRFGWFDMQPWNP